MESIVHGFLFVLHPLHFPFLFIGVTLGIIVGALPGLTASVGIILLLPFVFYLDVSTAMVMLCGAFCGGIYGGSISAILISTPGTPSAAATVLDGYPLAQKGEAGKAIGVATIASTSGGIISTFCLMFFAPKLARIALQFGPEEYFESDGITLVEWADRVSDCLPSDRIEVHIEPAGRTQRQFRIRAVGERYGPVIDKLRARVCP